MPTCCRCVDELDVDRQVPQNFSDRGDVDITSLGVTKWWTSVVSRRLAGAGVTATQHSDSVRPESGLILPMAKKGILQIGRCWGFTPHTEPLYVPDGSSLRNKHASRCRWRRYGGWPEPTRR